MKNRILIAIAAVALFAVLISSAFAIVVVPVPPRCNEAPCGFTPGFWKHNIQVRLSNAPYNLDLTNGAYSAFDRANLPQSPYYNLDGVKLDDDLMDALLSNSQLGAVFAGSRAHHFCTSTLKSATSRKQSAPNQHR